MNANPVNEMILRTFTAVKKAKAEGMKLTVAALTEQFKKDKKQVIAEYDASHKIHFCGMAFTMVLHCLEAKLDKVTTTDQFMLVLNEYLKV